MANENKAIYTDDFLKRLKNIVCDVNQTHGDLVVKQGYSISVIEEVLKQTKTVDAVEVVHGRWVASGCGFDCCSECHKVYADGYLTAMGIKPRTQFNYCPNCGAKMDGDGNGDS